MLFSEHMFFSVGPFFNARGKHMITDMVGHNFGPEKGLLDGYVYLKYIVLREKRTNEIYQTLQESPLDCEK